MLIVLVASKLFFATIQRTGIVSYRMLEARYCWATNFPTRKLKLILLSFFAVAGMQYGNLALAATTVQIDTARDNALAWLISNQNGDGSWKSVAGTEVVSTATAFEAIQRTGVSGYPVVKASSWLGNAVTKSTDTLARQIISSYNAGLNIDLLMTRLLSLRGSLDFSWGAYEGYGGSFPDTSLAMDAIKITVTPDPNETNTIVFIVGSQNLDGGWAYAPSESSSPQSRIVPTVYNLLTLNRYKATNAVQPIIDASMNWLLAQQNMDSGFGEDSTSTAYETALAYQAITAELGIAAPTAIDAQDFLIAQQLPDGSWSGDPFQTALILQTLPAVLLDDTDNDGVPDNVETILGTDPYLFDSRYLAAGSSQAEAGTTVPTFIAEIGRATFFSTTLQNTGGSGPFMWTITSGTLPEGLSLDQSTGQISGNPTTVGTFNFSYSVTDSEGTSITVVAQITVLLADGDLNADGLVNAADVVLVTRIALGLIVPTANQLIRGDVAPAGSPNGVINAGDVARIQLKALGVISF